MPNLPKDLLSLHHLSKETILEILDVARIMRTRVARGEKNIDLLKGKSVVNLFYENSTRTRASFELAAKYLSAHVLNISASSSSVQKGESLKDTALTLDRLHPDVIVMRHPASGAHEILAKAVKAHVLNGGDGTHAHPTQALLDFLTISDYKQFENLRVVIVGDALHSRVVRSNIVGLKTLGAQVTLSGPSTLVPKTWESLGVDIEHSFDKALDGADVVMMLRIQRERQKVGLFPTLEEYAHFYELTERRLQLAKKDAIVLHPGPINRGIEIAPEVADSPRAKINEQVTNGLAVRMALLWLLTKEDTQCS